MWIRLQTHTAHKFILNAFAGRLACITHILLFLHCSTICTRITTTNDDAAKNNREFLNKSKISHTNLMGFLRNTPKFHYEFLISYHSNYLVDDGSFDYTKRVSFRAKCMLHAGEKATVQLVAYCIPEYFRRPTLKRLFLIMECKTK